MDRCIFLSKIKTQSGVILHFYFILVWFGTFVEGRSKMDSHWYVFWKCRPISFSTPLYHPTHVGISTPSTHPTATTAPQRPLAQLLMDGHFLFHPSPLLRRLAPSRDVPSQRPRSSAEVWGHARRVSQRQYAMHLLMDSTVQRSTDTLIAWERRGGGWEQEATL
jgi:hypothetical protein